MYWISAPAWAVAMSPSVSAVKNKWRSAVASRGKELIELLDSIVFMRSTRMIGFLFVVTEMTLDFLVLAGGVSDLRAGGGRTGWERLIG